MKSTLKVAIIHPSPNVYSETFIRNHIEYLPCEVIEMNGGFLPTNIMLESNIYPIVSNPKRVISSITNKIFCTNINPAIPSIQKILKREKIQIVLAEYGPSGMAILPICLELGIPLVVHFHGYDAHRRSTITENLNYQPLVANVAAVVGVSTKMCAQLEYLGFSSKQIHYIVYGVTDLFFSTKKLVEDSIPTLVAVGRFTSKKAPYITIMAFAKTLQVVPNAKLKMIGTGGDLLDACIQLTKIYGIEKNVDFLGVQSPMQVAEHLSRARAFVQHSLESIDGDCEGTPNAVLEAGAIGLPVISTYHAGIADVIIHERTGLLSAERDVEAMAQNMVRILQDGEYAQKLGAQAKIHIKENYHIDISIKKLWELIKNIAK